MNIKNDALVQNISGLFISNENILFMRKLQMYFGTLSSPNLEAKPKQNKIGAWIYSDIAKCYIREEGEDSWWWEKGREKISISKDNNTFRICLIGESAAHGMFFSPWITPAKTIEFLLNKETQKEKFEVIDLTRICMSSSTMLETFRSVNKINPDLVIIFAGNNWFSDTLYDEFNHVSESRIYYDAFDKRDFSLMIDLFYDNFTDNCETIFENINSHNKLCDFKTIFVVPPTNLTHWERSTPLLKGNYDFLKWYSLLEEGLKFFDNKNYDQAFIKALEMIKIDNNTSSTSQRLAGNSLLKLGRDSEAFSYLKREGELAIVNSNLTSFPVTPECISEIIKSKDYSFNIIYLEGFFQRKARKKCLGEDLFIDYCHLNLKGFLWFAEAIIKEIPGFHAFDCGDLDDEFQLQINSDKLSSAYLYIAIYKSHFDQPISTEKQLTELKKLLMKSVSISNIGLDLMEAYVKAKTALAAFNLSQGAQDLLSLTESELDLQISQSCLGVDSQIIEAICSILDDFGKNGCKLKYNFVNRFECIFYEKGYDLTHPFFLERINSLIREAEDHEINTRRAIPFYKAYWPESHFELPLNNPQDITIDVVSRTPLTNKMTLRLLVNNAEVGSVNTSDKWSNSKLNIGKKFLKQGFNRLSVRLDLNDPINVHQNLRKNCNLSELLLNSHTDFTYVFYELHNLKVRPI